MTWLIDFEGYSYRNAPPISIAMKTLNILQNHYPERLGLAVCYHPPRLFQLTWKVHHCHCLLPASKTQTSWSILLCPVGYLGIIANDNLLPVQCMVYVLRLCQPVLACAMLAVVAPAPL